MLWRIPKRRSFGVRSGAKGKRAQDLGTQAQASWQNGEKALVV